MGSAAWLATQLDAAMLDKGIAPVGTPIGHLAMRKGVDVALELAGRPLLRYVPLELAHETRDSETFVCPTPYSVDDLTAFLALPSPKISRDFVIVLDPAKIERIQGPRWCDLGQGIEYVLPNGYGADAIMAPGWAVPVR